MEKKFDQTAEVKKAIEEFKARHSDMHEMSLKELSAVSGGVPEYFDFGGYTCTPAELYATTRQFHDELGPAVAHQFLREMLTAAGYSHVEEAMEAYRVYGPNMWGSLTSQGM